MRRVVQFLLVVACLALFTGCFLLRKQIRSEMIDFYNEEVVKQVRKEMIDYYENLANAYKLLGFGYYQLYKEAEAKGDRRAAEQYRNNAALYKTYSDDLKKSAQAWRESLGVAKAQGEPQKTTSAAAGPGKPPSPTEPRAAAAGGQQPSKPAAATKVSGLKRFSPLRPLRWLRSRLSKKQ